ncbi:MAG: DUF2802 domain-containing protein [Steroidobacteraceae bacterium]
MDVTMLVVAAVAALAVLAAVVLGASLRRVSRRLGALEARFRDAAAAVSEELAQVAAQGRGVEDRLRGLERELGLLSDRQGRLELRGEGRPFEQAIVMLRAGATRAELVARLGLSDSEAALLAQLHGARPAAAHRAQA